MTASGKRDVTIREPAGARNGSRLGGRSVRRRRASSTGPVGLLFRQLAPQSSPMFGSLSLKNWPCRPGPAGPPTASRSASEPRERGHRSGQKQRPAPGGAQDRPAVRVPWFSGPAGAVALAGRNRGARKASLPPGSLSPLPPGARVPLALCETLAALGDEPQISQHQQRSGNPKNICENLSNLWMTARSLRSE